MGCSSSKTVAAEPFPPSDVQKEEVTTPQARPRQARLSLAGNFDQFESFKKPKGVANDHSGNGCIYSPRSDAPHITYAFISQKGHYPDQPFKANQDAVTVIEDFSDDPLSSLMIVFDGHGETGAQCAHFAKSKLPAALSSNPHLQSNPQKALKESMLLTNADLHKSPIDDTLSGTTACAALFKGNTVCVANVGDSRAVLAVKKPDSNKLIAVDLSSDQTPFREDECSRVKRAGARVLTLDQIEGLKDASVPCWTNEENCDGDPPRLWASDGIYPGTAFTRSIGDSGMISYLYSFLSLFLFLLFIQLYNTVFKFLEAVFSMLDWLLFSQYSIIHLVFAIQTNEIAMQLPNPSV